ncbi:INO80 complex subunit C [Tachysurus fulvidraco]|uniref:INO80 complex subunit C n=1 Tax=Tachysurus fulvidraco TaxID=1234273 RepID=UPI001FEE121A|nr:INO80 complex subunit C [Tachysurus fulvidraco]
MAAQCPSESFITGETNPAVNNNVKHLSITPSVQAKGKKRAVSPAAQMLTQPSSNNNKRRKVQSVSGVSHTQALPVELADGKLVPTVDGISEPVTKPLSFKDPNFVHSGIGGVAAGKKNRTWKNLKQILAAERALPWNVCDPNYYNIDAPPSMKPPKKYSDISGLPANYTDPQTKLRFTSTEEFSYIRLLPTDVVTGYLTLRKATCIVP